MYFKGLSFFSNFQKQYMILMCFLFSLYDRQNEYCCCYDILCMYFFFRLHGVHGTDWVTIGQLMGRSRMSVNRKFSTLPATKGQLTACLTTLSF